jgi:glutathione S-transferase
MTGRCGGRCCEGFWLEPKSLLRQGWVDHHNEKVVRALDTLEQRCDRFESAPTIGEITIACTLGYRDIRFAETDWRPGRAALAQWFEHILQRDSLRNTMPA